jgi:hypothetical protein
MITCRLLLIAISLAFTVVCAGSTPAAEFRDPKTGLAVNLPLGFTARLGEPILGDTVEIEVERTDPETSCAVSFEENPANRNLTQEQINALASKPEWLELIRTAMSALNDILSLDRMTQDGALGAVMILKSKMALLERIQIYQAFFETRRGRTVILCSAQLGVFESLRADYDAITRGITLPR